MGAWGKDQNVGDKVMMLADGNCEFTKAMGLELDGTANGMGSRSQRYSMLVDNGVIKQLFVEAPRAYEVSSADHMLKTPKAKNQTPVAIRQPPPGGGAGGGRGWAPSTM